MRQNGILAYPPQMAVPLCRFVVQAYASFLSLSLSKRLPPELEGEIQKDLPPKPFKRDANSPNRYSAQIAVDLRGLPKNYPAEKMASFFSYLPVNVSLGIGGPLGTFSWKRKEGRSEVIASPQIDVFLQFAFAGPLGHIPLSVEHYRKIKDQLCATLRHELQHFTQYLLRMALGVKKVEAGGGDTRKEGAGFIPEHSSPEMKAARAKIKRIRDNILQATLNMSPTEREQFLNSLQYTEYALNPFEFFPWMADFRARLASQVRGQKGKRRITAEMIQAVENEDPKIAPFMDRLKKAAPLLRRRVLSEMHGFANTFNAAEAKREQEAKKPINANRVISAVLADMDQERAPQAGYLRKHRQHYLDFAQSNLKQP
jgi:hypothetical protein